MGSGNAGLTVSKKCRGLGLNPSLHFRLCATRRDEQDCASEGGSLMTKCAAQMGLGSGMFVKICQRSGVQVKSSIRGSRRVSFFPLLGGVMEHFGYTLGVCWFEVHLCTAYCYIKSSEFIG